MHAVSTALSTARRNPCWSCDRKERLDWAYRWCKASAHPWSPSFQALNAKNLAIYARLQEAAAAHAALAQQLRAVSDERDTLLRDKQSNGL